MRIRPRRIRLEASSHCQLRCESCPTTAGAIDAAVGKGFLRFADFQKLVDQNPRLEEIEISNYGEVFLNPELLQILEYAHERRVAVRIGNGANLNFARKEVLEALVRTRVRQITCSIDGARPESYAKYRVRGNFESVIANIQTINRFKSEYGSSYPRLSWQFIVFGFNEDEIAEARAMATDLGMEFKLKLSWDDSFSPIKDVDRVREQMGGFASREEFLHQKGKPYLEQTCNQLWETPQINWNGDVLGCCRNFWGTFGGNAFEDGLEKAVNGERIEYARSMLKGEVPARSDIPCTTCKIYLARRQHTNWIPAAAYGLVTAMRELLSHAIRTARRAFAFAR